MSAPGEPAAAPGPPPPASLPHDSLQNNIIVATVMTWVIAAIFVAIRFYTRVFIIHVLGWSDWFILSSLVFSFGNSVGAIEQALRGSGRHIYDLDPTDTQNSIGWVRASWYALLFYTLSLGASKISILILYLRIFTYTWVQRAGKVILVIVVLTTIYMVIVVSTACVPLVAYWDPSVPAVFCQPQNVWWANTGILMITDFLIFLLPMPVVWGLKLPKRQRYILLGIFGLGFFVCFITILRVQNLVQVKDYPDPDPLYSAAVLTYWTVIEVNAGVVVACIMTMKPFVNKFFPFLLSSSSAKRSTGANSDVRVAPPTIGSLPNKELGYSNGTQRSWPDEDFDDGDEIELNNKAVQATDAISISSAGNAQRRDLEAQRRSTIAATPDLPSLPQDARLKPLNTDAFYHSASDKSTPDLIIMSP